VKLWPTPTASDWNTPVKKRTEQGGKAYRSNLKEAVKLWPTPRAAGLCGGTGGGEALKVKCAGIDEARKMGAGNGGRLNADWVERLMGYPDGWTDIEKEGIDTENRYPAAWLDGSWDTIPRTAVKQENRKKRIQGLGNAVAPQVTAYLFGLIKKAVWPGTSSYILEAANVVGSSLNYYKNYVKRVLGRAATDERYNEEAAFWAKEAAGLVSIAEFGNEDVKRHARYLLETAFNTGKGRYGKSEIRGNHMIDKLIAKVWRYS
jgi:hypothetical protein